MRFLFTSHKALAEISSLSLRALNTHPLRAKFLWLPCHAFQTARIYLGSRSNFPQQTVNGNAILPEATQHGPSTQWRSFGDGSFSELDLYDLSKHEKISSLSEVYTPDPHAQNSYRTRGRDRRGTKYTPSSELVFDSKEFLRSSPVKIRRVRALRSTGRSQEEDLSTLRAKPSQSLHDQSSGSIQRDSYLQRAGDWEDASRQSKSDAALSEKGLPGSSLRASKTHWTKLSGIGKQSNDYSDRDFMPVQRLLTREERYGLNGIANSLDEVLNFAHTTGEIPWQADELPQKQQYDKMLDSELSEDAAYFKGDHGKAGPSSYTALFSTTTGRRISYQSVLAGFIDIQVRKHSIGAEQYDVLLSELFSDDNLRWLETHGGATIEDIVAWSWILQGRTLSDAVMRFLAWTNQPMPHQRAPLFLFHMLLKRARSPNPRVVQLLTKHLAHRLENTIDNNWQGIWTRIHGEETLEVIQKHQIQTANYRTSDPWTVGMYILRLMSFAQYSTPLLLPALAQMMCKELHHGLCKTSTTDREDELTIRSAANVSLILNKAIVVVARKSAEPIVSVPYQESAQFILVRYMNSFKPALVINIHSYRAIVRVQLAHRKTTKERLWTELKSRAWPPYREDKLGIDALKRDDEYGTSRAQRALLNMQEAGNSPKTFEHSASILSGWDINKAPTIQSRRLFLDFLPVRDSGEAGFDQSIWKSRLLATRTIEEAWAVFLNYMEEDIPRHSEVFLAMFEKIVYERDRVAVLGSTQSRNISTVVAGDSPQTLPSSRNPREQVYIPSPPPSFTTFYQQYLTQFSVLNLKALCFLLPCAETLDQGYKFIEHSILKDKEKNMLLRRSMYDKHKTSTNARVLVAYVRMLGKFASAALPNHSTISALSHAIHLVTSHGLRSRGPWRAILQAIHTELGDKTTETFWHQHWNIVLGILQRMEKLNVYQDSEMFHTVCSLFTSLLRKTSKTSPCGRYHAHTPGFESAAEVRKRTGHMLKQMFSRLVSPDFRTQFVDSEKESPFVILKDPEAVEADESGKIHATSLISHLLVTPSPPTLHVFVRLLGMLEDKRAVYELVQWMALSHRELHARSMEMARGKAHMRYTLIAVRIIMETSIVPWVSRLQPLELEGLDLEYATDTKRITESVESWAGWPTDEEVETYWEHGQEQLHDSDTEA